MPQEAISRFLGIDGKTLRKYYDDILATAANDANSKIANILYRKCVEDENMSAITFWLKTRAKWRETDSIKDAAKELMLELAAVRSGGKVDPKAWVDAYSQRSDG